MQYVHRNENYGLSNDNETKLASTMVKGQQSEMKTELQLHLYRLYFILPVM